MRNFIQPGETLPCVAPAGGVQSGGGYKINRLFVVAVTSAAEGESFEGKTRGVFELPKLSGQVWDMGVLVYWDAANERCTTVATGNMLIGCAAAPGSSATGEVRLNGVAVADAV